MFATIAGACGVLEASSAQAALPLKPVFIDRIPQGEVIHFVLPDRFAHGDVANDRGCLRVNFSPVARAAGSYRTEIGPLDCMICVSEVGL